MERTFPGVKMRVAFSLAARQAVTASGKKVSVTERTIPLQLALVTRKLRISQLNTKLALDASSNSTSHTQLPQLLCEKFRGGLKNLLKRLPSPLTDFKTNPVDQDDQRTIVCFRHADNTSHLKLPLIERVLKHIIDICDDVELAIGAETQTSNMRRVNATRNLSLIHI